jgi:uncharacterized protein YdaU (DUF1376 family)
MNYYERHLGDYARSAGHLSMLEHGAYTCLLDRYYITEQGIPAQEAHRLCRAATTAEKKAVDAVLKEFFFLRDGVWLKDKCEKEIEKARLRISRAKENGKNGGRPKAHKHEPEANPAGYQWDASGMPVATQSQTGLKAHHTPDTRHHSPEENTHTPTACARVCVLLRREGVSDVNPGHPGLMALVAAGCSDAEFTGAAVSAVGRGKGFAYLLGTLKRQREEAAKAVLHTGPMPSAETPYARQMRERMEEFAPEIAAKRPGTKGVVIDMESINAVTRRLG